MVLNLFSLFVNSAKMGCQGNDVIDVNSNCYFAVFAIYLFSKVGNVNSFSLISRKNCMICLIFPTKLQIRNLKTGNGFNIPRSKNWTKSRKF